VRISFFRFRFPDIFWRLNLIFSTLFFLLLLKCDQSTEIHRIFRLIRWVFLIFLWLLLLLFLLALRIFHLFFLFIILEIFFSIGWLVPLIKVLDVSLGQIVRELLLLNV